MRGPLFLQQDPEFVALMRSDPAIQAGYMTEGEILRVAQAQDYLACLFEESWDLNSESATFWLAVKVLRPVVCFAKGWVADMVRATGCGVIISCDAFERLDEFLPARDSAEYQNLLETIERYRNTLTARRLWATLNDAIENG